MAVILILIPMSLIVGNSFKFTTLVRISADTIRIVYEMRPCADIPSGWHPVNTATSALNISIECGVTRSRYYSAGTVRYR